MNGVADRFSAWERFNLTVTRRIIHGLPGGDRGVASLNESLYLTHARIHPA